MQIHKSEIKYFSELVRNSLPPGIFLHNVPFSAFAEKEIEYLHMAIMEDVSSKIQDEYLRLEERGVNRQVALFLASKALAIQALARKRWDVYFNASAMEILCSTRLLDFVTPRESIILNHRIHNTFSGVIRNLLRSQDPISLTEKAFLQVFSTNSGFKLSEIWLYSPFALSVKHGSAVKNKDVLLLHFCAQATSFVALPKNALRAIDSDKEVAELLLGYLSLRNKISWLEMSIQENFLLKAPPHVKDFESSVVNTEEVADLLNEANSILVSISLQEKGSDTLYRLIHNLYSILLSFDRLCAYL